jgi:hypothetical protein
MVKVTFTLDEPTIARLRLSAQRLRRPQSAVVREAINDYALQVGRLSESERRQMLGVFDRVVARIPPRSLAEVECELDTVRKSRRSGGRRSKSR